MGSSSGLLGICEALGKKVGAAFENHDECEDGESGTYREMGEDQYREYERGDLCPSFSFRETSANHNPGNGKDS